MSANDIQKLINSLAKSEQDNEKLAIPLLVNKLKKLAEVNPYDQTIVSMSKILKQASEKKLIISRKEFQDIYKRLYSRNTKFASYFAEELGDIEKAPLPKYADKLEAPLNTNDAGNNVLTAILKSALDNTGPETLYTKEQALKAISSVNETLELWGAKASRLEVLDGNKTAIVIKADYDTPKGVVSMLIPLEVKGGVISEPRVFVGNNTAKKIDHTNIKNYLTDCINAKLATVGRIGQKDLEVEKSDSFDNFAEKLENPLGAATFKFGTENVNLGRDAIARSLAGLGIDYPQISIMGSDKNNVIYGVSISGKVSFKVPVKIANNKVVMPEMMICNGSLMSLSRANINRLFVDNQTDYKAAASVSPLYGLKANELLTIVKEAAAEQNYAKAEDAMNILETMGNEAVYKQAVQEYMSGLSIVKTAETKTTCAMVIKSANSQHPVCGHTGLALHLTYTDKYGNCLPLYRKDMPEQTESAWFMASKVFSG